MITAIAILRDAAGVMTRDGQTAEAARLTLEASIAEAFDGRGYKLGAPDPIVVEAAHDYLEGASA